MGDENKDVDIDKVMEAFAAQAASAIATEANVKAMNEKLDAFLEEKAKQNKAQIRSDEELKEIGKNYGFIHARKDVAKGLTSKAPLWSDKTEGKFQKYLKMIKDGEKVIDIQKAFGDNVQDGLSNWTPTEFVSELVRLSYINSVMLPKVTIVPMGRDKLDMPKPSGDLAWGFVDPGGAMVEDKFTAGKLSLDTAKAYGMALVNQEDLDDPAYPVASYIAAQLAEDNAIFLDKVILYGDANGSGAAWEGKFDGWSDATSVQEVAGSTDASPTFAELLTVANLAAMVGKLEERELAGAEFFFSPQGWEAIRNIQFNVSDGAGGTIASGQPLIPINADWGYKLFGFPTNITSRVLTAAAVSVSVGFFGDPKYIYFGDRMDMSIATSAHYRFANDQVVFRAMQRFAVTVGLPASLVKISFGASA